MKTDTLTVIRGACGHDCPDTCSWLVEVRDGVADRLYGDRDHPFTRGTLCAKVNHYLDRVYHPDRVIYPMKRVAAKGEGSFVRVTWDEALSEISTRWRAIMAESGGEAILPYSLAGNQGLIQMASLDRRRFGLLGFSGLEWNICGEVASEGISTTQGCGFGVDPEELVPSRFIVLWGTNTIVTNLHLWPVIAEARRRGAKIVVVDPIRTRTAEQADWHVALRPESDAALALAMMHVIVRDDLVDHDYVAKYATGYEQLCERLQEYSTLNQQGLLKPELNQSGVRVLNMRDLGNDLCSRSLSPPIRSLFVYNCNPAVSMPNQGQIIKGLRRDDLFTVVHDLFVTETARFADYVLPATSQIECLDIVPAWGHHYLSLNRPAIVPLGDCVSNTELMRRLARALGRTESWLFESDESLLRTALDSRHPWLQRITFERLWDEGYVRLNHDRDWRPFAKGGFPTRSGKAELWSESLRERGLDPLPSSGQIRKPTGDALQLITGKTLHFLNSSYAHMDPHQKREGQLFVELNIDDARRRNLCDGDLARVSNHQGEVTAECRISGRVRPGIAWMPFGGIHDASGLPLSANVLTPEEPTDWGGGSGFYDAFVEVAKCNKEQVSC